MSRFISLSKTMAAAVVNNIATAQSATGAVSLTLNGSAVSAGLASLDTQRRILITSASSDGGITFAVFGTNEAGSSINETVTGAGSGAAASTVQDFLTVTKVSTSGATATTVQVGTSATGSTPWKFVDPHVTPPAIAVALIPGTGGTVSAEYTYDDFLNIAPGGPFPTVWSNAPGQLAAGMKGSTTNVDTVLTFSPRGLRMTTTAGTAANTIQIVQAGIRQ